MVLSPTEVSAASRLQMLPLLRQSQQLTDEMDALRKRLSVLRVKGSKKAPPAPGVIKSLNIEIAKKEEQKGIVEKKLVAHIEPHAQTTCRQFCEQVHSALPREIRDIIYEYLYVQETIYVGPEYLLRAGQPSENNRGAHIWDAAYVGQDMQREMIESWYRTTLFYFYDKANNTRVVTQFLNFDRWGLGLKPHDFICRVRFELSAMDHRFHNNRACCYVRDFADTFARPLENLHQLPNHVHFFIRIHTYGALRQNCIRQEELQKTVDVLVKKLKDFNAAGHRWVVQWSELSDLEFRSKTGGYDADAWMEELSNAIEPLRSGWEWL